MNKYKSYLLIIFLIATSCSKEKKYQYEVSDVNVLEDSGTKKTHQKSNTEFISIAYSDLFGTNIPQTKLVNLSVAYNSFGDLKVIEERIISNFLNDPNVIVPAQISVNGDTTQFIINAYKKFYNRQPNEFEKRQWKEMIRTDAGVTPVTVYFVMMTSDEYRFF